MSSNGVGASWRLALGYGSLYNHSYRPNARYVDLSERTKLFTAIRDIAAGEEITVNYNGEPEDQTPVGFDVVECPSVSRRRRLVHAGGSAPVLVLASGCQRAGACVEFPARITPLTRSGAPSIVEANGHQGPSCRKSKPQMSLRSVQSLLHDEAIKLRRRNRLVQIILVMLVCLLGIGFRRYARVLPGFIAAYAGDTLWALAAFLGIGLIFSRAQTRTIALLAMSFSAAIDFSQLYHAPWIDSIRQTPLGGLILGFEFLWSDLACYALGVGLDVAIEIIARYVGSYKS